MDTRPEKEVPDTTEVSPAESQEKLSPQGIASIQGADASASAEQTGETDPGKEPATETLKPPEDYRPAMTDGTEKAGANKIETGVEKPEKEMYTYRDNETGKPGGLNHRPSGPERGG